MKLRIYILLVLYVQVKRLKCTEHKCLFEESEWKIDTVNSPRKSYFQCTFKNVELINENETIAIDSSDNPKTNKVVQLISYDSETIKFIPSQIFEIFQNVEYFWMASRLNFKNIKPRYFKSATSLKTLGIYNNDIEDLPANLFAETPNLEYINFEKNLIERVHVQAFKGLSKLQGVYLKGNKILNLNPVTFSGLESLKSIDLSNNECTGMSFLISKGNFRPVEEEIRLECIF